MKQESYVIKEKNECKISEVINDTAIIKCDNRIGLLNIKTNQLICKLDIYDKTIDYDKNLIILIRNRDSEDYAVYIYDSKEEKMIVDGWKPIPNHRVISSSLLRLESPLDHKMHLFNTNTYKGSNDIFDMAIDNTLGLQLGGYDYYCVIEKNGKKGIYSADEGLKTPIEYDEIKIFEPNGELKSAVLTKNNEKYFAYFDDLPNTSEAYDDITFDKNNKNIIYGHKNDIIYVYHTYFKRVLFTTHSNELKCIDARLNRRILSNFTFYFETVDNDNHGAIALTCDEQSNLKISTLNHNKYDRVEHLKDDYFALYRKDDYCDIVKFNPDGQKTIVKKCKIKGELNYDHLIYEKNHKYGLLILSSTITKYKEHYDDINMPVHPYCITETNNKKGLIAYHYLLGEKYDDIVISPTDKGPFYLRYVALRDGKNYRLAKIQLETLEFVDDNIYSLIEFYPDFMILKDDEAICLYDYDKNLIATYPLDTEILYKNKDTKKEWEDPIYSINGTSYYYKKNKFEKIYTAEEEAYIAKFETDDDIFEIKTYDQHEHDSLCSTINGKDDLEAEETLNSMVNNSCFYPTLSLKKTKKN